MNQQLVRLDTVQAILQVGREPFDRRFVSLIVVCFGRLYVVVLPRVGLQNVLAPLPAERAMAFA